MITDHEGAYWLSDKIAIAQRHILIFKSKDFQVWDLKVHADQRAMLTCGLGLGARFTSSASASRIFLSQASGSTIQTGHPSAQRALIR